MWIETYGGRQVLLVHTDAVLFVLVICIICFCLSVELVYGLWPVVPGFSVRVVGFPLSHSICTVTAHRLLYRDMIIFRNSNTCTWARGEIHLGFRGEI
jgi:hypothetical protein